MLVVKDRDVQIDKLVLGPYSTNCYILQCRATHKGVLIDAPAEAHAISKHIDESEIQYILLTHCHIDHIEALSELISKHKIPVAAHQLDAKRLTSPPDRLLTNEDQIAFGKITLKVLYTPGHTPGSLCFLLKNYLFSGDTLFPGGPGKTPSPSDFNHIITSLTEKIFTLPDDTQIYPGHGESTTLKNEKEKFKIFSSKQHTSPLYGDIQWLSF
jgi:glyoxylase-like metal-dependent hydrolase (beta-lactamase superfamily II)